MRFEQEATLEADRTGCPELGLFFFQAHMARNLRTDVLAEDAIDLIADVGLEGLARVDVLAGDLNATPDSQPLRTLREEWQSATEGQADMLTFPAVKPERQLDYILARPKGRFAVRSVKVINEHVASDHCPLFAEVAVQ